MDENPWSVDSIYDFNYFCCPECDSKSRTKQEFVNHATSSHPKSIDAFNRISDGSLSDIELPEVKIEDIKDDPEEPAKKKPKTCHQCDFKAPNASQLVNHLKQVHEDLKLEQFTCSECLEIFENGQDLKLHLWNLHKIGKGQEKCLCSLCGKTIIGRSNFKKHEREKHGIISANFVQRRKPVKIECSKCLQEFKTPTELNQHTIDCLGESKDFSCIDCDLKWANGPVLNIHLKIDHKYPEMYTCHFCGKCLKKKASMESHIKVEHEKKKDHICHLCGTGFARAQGLRFHMQRIHEHSGKYACEYCSFRTVAQLQLDIHVNAVHTKSKKFQCNDCNFFCYHRQGLLAHVKTVHLKLKPHQCSKCFEAYVRRKDLEKHKELTGHKDDE